jgi:hypothetical protein
VADGDDGNFLALFFAAPASFLTVTLILFFLAWVKLPAAERN